MRPQLDIPVAGLPLLSMESRHLHTYRNLHTFTQLLFIELSVRETEGAAAFAVDFLLSEWDSASFIRTTQTTAVQEAVI